MQRRIFPNLHFFIVVFLLRIQILTFEAISIITKLVKANLINVCKLLGKANSNI